MDSKLKKLLDENDYESVDISSSKKMEGALKVEPEGCISPLYLLESNPDTYENRIKIWNENEAEIVFVINNNGEHYSYDAKSPPLISSNANKNLGFEIPNRKSLANGQFYADVSRKISNLKRRTVDEHLIEALELLLRNLTDAGLSGAECHGLIDRCLFASFLDHRQLWKPKCTLAYALDEKSVNDVNNIFDQLASKFNGELSRAPRVKLTTEILQLLINVFSFSPYANQQRRLFPYRFDLINTDLISSIFERFIEATAIWTNNESGTYYTPPQIAYRVAEEAMSSVLNLKTEEELFKVKILDPCCGSGVFLVQAFSLLRNKINKLRKERQKKALNANECSELLISTISGWDIEPTAIRITAFSLTLSILDRVESISEDFKFPYLIDQILICRDGLLNGVISSKELRTEQVKQELELPDEIKNENITYDVVIGNPPWGFKSFSKSYKEKLKLLYPQPLKGSSSEAFTFKFLELAGKQGAVGILVNTSVLANRTSDFRIKLEEANKLNTIIDFSEVHKAIGYSSSGEFTSALFFKALDHNADRKIKFIAPKLTPFSRLMNYILISEEQIKHIDLNELNYLEENYGLNPLTIMHSSKSQTSLIKRVFNSCEQGQINAQKGAQILKGSNILKPFKTKEIGLLYHRKDNYDLIPKEQLRRTAVVSQRLPVLLRRHEVKGRLNVAVKDGEFTILDDVIALGADRIDKYALSALLVSKFARFILKYLARQYTQRSHSYLDDTAIKLFPIPSSIDENKTDALNLLSSLGKSLEKIMREENESLLSSSDVEPILEEIDDIVSYFYELTFAESNLIDSYFDEQVVKLSLSEMRDSYINDLKEQIGTKDLFIEQVLGGLAYRICTSKETMFASPDDIVLPILSGNTCIVFDHNITELVIYKANYKSAWSKENMLKDSNYISYKRIAREIKEEI